MDLHLLPTTPRQPPEPWAPAATAPGPALPHAGPLDGATATGEASRRHLAVRVGLWVDEGGRVRRARWRPGLDPQLAACADRACALLEAGADPAGLEAAALRDGGAAEADDRAELAAAAVRSAAALCSAVR